MKLAVAVTTFLFLQTPVAAQPDVAADSRIVLNGFSSLHLDKLEHGLVALRSGCDFCSDSIRAFTVHMRQHPDAIIIVFTDNYSSPPDGRSNIHWVRCWLHEDDCEYWLDDLHIGALPSE